MITRNRTFFTSFLLLSSLFLYVFLQLYIASPKQSARRLISQAQENCPDPTGQETYTQNIQAFGPHIAANNNPVNYKQLRKLFNCLNPGDRSFIPTTVVYDLFFLKSGAQVIQNNLTEMKKYGLFPIIRVASYTDGAGNWIKLHPPTDAKIMGENLAKALNNVGGFPQKPIVVFWNEPNLNMEWAGQTNPTEFAESFAVFFDAMGQGNFQIFFPGLSYGARAGIGISPSQFLTGFFRSQKFGARKLDGVDLNIYGTDYADIQAQYAGQIAPFAAYLANFNQPLKTIIGELGPVAGGRAVEDCAAAGVWTNVAGPIIQALVRNPSASFATLGCFGGNTYPAVAKSDGTNVKLGTLAQYGSTGLTDFNNAPGQNANTGKQTAKKDGPVAINFEPENPAANTAFSVVSTSNTDYVYVYLKIFKQGDDKNPVWVAADNLADEPAVSGNKPYKWTYRIAKGKPQSLANGEYKVVFYADCANPACEEKYSRTLSIGAGKTNPRETLQAAQAAPGQNNAGGQQNKNQQPAANQGQNKIGEAQQPVTNEAGAGTGLQMTGRLQYSPGRVIIEFTQQDLNWIMPTTAELCYRIDERGKPADCRRAGTVNQNILIVEYDVKNKPLGIKMDLTPAERQRQPGHLAWLPIP